MRKLLCGLGLVLVFAGISGCSQLREGYDAYREFLSDAQETYCTTLSPLERAAAEGILLDNRISVDCSDYPAAAPGMGGVVLQFPETAE